MDPERLSKGASDQKSSLDVAKRSLDIICVASGSFYFLKRFRFKEGSCAYKKKKLVSFKILQL